MLWIVGFELWRRRSCRSRLKWELLWVWRRSCCRSMVQGESVVVCVRLKGKKLQKDQDCGQDVASSNCHSWWSSSSTCTKCCIHLCKAPSDRGHIHSSSPHPFYLLGTYPFAASRENLARARARHLILENHQMQSTRWRTHADSVHSLINLRTIRWRNRDLDASRLIISLPGPTPLWSLVEKLRLGFEALHDFAAATSSSFSSASVHRLLGSTGSFKTETELGKDRNCCRRR